MPEWLFEDGIGETRAALVEGDRILEAAIELADDGLRVGTVADAKLIELTPIGGIVAIGGQEALLHPVPPRTGLGATARVEIVREALPEPGRIKRAKAIPADAPPANAPDLLARIGLTNLPVRQLRAHQPDALEQAGWSELLDEATGGEIAFAGGALRLSPTPAMTLFDIDGTGAAEPLALGGARAACEAIRRMGIGGSIGIDLPTLAGKGPRGAVAAVIDAECPRPFERTAMNGFGFVQIVRPRPRPSLPELLRADPTGAEVRALLRRLEREPPGTPLAHTLAPALLARLRSRPDWTAELARRTGRTHIIG